MTIIRSTPDGWGQAEFSDDERYRYRLSRLWDRTKDMILWIMLNPSTATEEVFDPTVRRCYDWSQEWGYGCMEVCNLFAYRSTSPEPLLVLPDAGAVGPLNDERIEEAVKRAARVMVAWGTHPAIKKWDRAKQVLRIIFGNGKVPYTLRVTKAGYPNHPLYLPKNLKPTEYIEGDAKKLFFEYITAKSNALTKSYMKEGIVLQMPVVPIIEPADENGHCNGSGWIKIYIGDGAGRTSGLPAESARKCPGCPNCQPKGT